VERGGTVTVARTHFDPLKMVTIKMLSSGFIKELVVCRHESLRLALELYKFNGELFVITDYAVTSTRCWRLKMTSIPVVELGPFLSRAV
jgi:hypothetical protein